MRALLPALQNCLSKNIPATLVTVIGTRGSSPRECGARMLISKQEQWGSIGGGNLEFQAAAKARQMISGSERIDPQCEEIALGSSLGQCCGGAVTLRYVQITEADRNWIEHLFRLSEGAGQVYSLTPLHGSENRRRVLTAEQAKRFFPQGDVPMQAVVSHKVEGQPMLLESLLPTRLPLLLFGAGHVGQAVVNTLKALPFQITWCDSREPVFPAGLPDNVGACITDNAEAAIKHASADSLYLIMTHDHREDLALVEAILKREDFSWLGLIGSRTKWKRFQHRLIAKGINEAQLQRVSCPVGIGGINSKQPEAIAVSVAAQLLQIHEQWQQAHSLNPQAASSLRYIHL